MKDRHRIRTVSVLPENGIAIFAMSTYNTDYIFVRDVDFEKSVKVLRDTNYSII